MAWTKQSVAKMLATRKRNKQLRVKQEGTAAQRQKTAATYLMQAERSMQKPYSEAELFALLALRVLTTK